MLSKYAKRESLTIMAIGLMLMGTATMLGWWWLVGLALVAMVALLAFFRDPHRSVPMQRGVVVSPADGRVSSIHQIEHFKPFGEAATCVRIFLSVLDVHINRSPTHAMVASVDFRPGQHLNALNPDSAEANQSNLIVLVHPTRGEPIAAVRQVAGMLARTIACRVKPNQIVQRGERIGMIKLGSTTELYLPASCQPQITVQQGQKVRAGATVMANVVVSNDVKTEPTSQPVASEPAVQKA